MSSHKVMRRSSRPGDASGEPAVTPVEVVTDQAPVYAGVLEELAPAAWHRTDQYANNRIALAI